MINELIEKEIEKLFGNFDCEPRIIKDLNRDDVELSLQTIAKEVAMRFQKKDQRAEYFDLVKDEDSETPEVCFDMSIGYNRCVQEINQLADQIINEVSE